MFGDLVSQTQIINLVDWNIIHYYFQQYLYPNTDQWKQMCHYKTAITKVLYKIFLCLEPWGE